MKSEVMSFLSSCAYPKMSSWLRNHIIATSLIIFLCSACPRIFFAWRIDLSDIVQSPDSYGYLITADNLIGRGAFLNKDGKPEVFRTPGYPAFLAFIELIVRRELRTVLIVQAAILSFEVLVLYWLARRILPPVPAFIGCLLAAFSPWGTSFAAVLMTEGLFLLLLALIFLVMKLVEEARNPGALLFSASLGLLTGAAVLVRPIWPLVVLIAGALFIHNARRKEVWLLLLVMLVCALTPLFLWKERNWRQRHFDGLSDVAGRTAYFYLASRVKAEINGLDRFAVSDAVQFLDRYTPAGLSVQEADEERWRQAKVIFREHPFVTAYCFVRSAFEHTIHPSPDVLTPAKLNFHGDYVFLASLWGGLLTLAYVGWRHTPDIDWDSGTFDRNFLFIVLAICLLLTLSSGISFGGGSRLRAPMETIIPLLAGVGVVRIVRAFLKAPCGEYQQPSYPDTGIIEHVVKDRTKR